MYLIMMKFKIMPLFLILTSTMTYAEKSKSRHVSFTYSSENDNSEKCDEIADFNMKGSLRKTFAVEAALYNTNKNMICSPISAFIPLGKLVLGANKYTREELLYALGYSDRHEVKSRLKNLIQKFKFLPGVVLTIASKIYVFGDFELKPEFSEEAREVFETSVDKINFESTHKAAKIINKWVEENTNGMIKDMMDPSTIVPMSSLFIINAVYFHGKWKYKFNSVTSGIFYSPQGPKNVPMISISKKFNYASNPVLDAQIVEIPYEEGNVSFIIVLPNDPFGLNVLLNRLKSNPMLLEQAFVNMMPAEVTLSLPKFKIETELDLQYLYQKVGVKSIFHSYSSELDSMIKYKDREMRAYVGKATQRAIIEVDESGTEASAASVIQIIGTMFLPAVNFTADRPFLFFVKALRQQLFAGTFVQP